MVGDVLMNTILTVADLQRTLALMGYINLTIRVRCHTHTIYVTIKSYRRINSIQLAYIKHHKTIVIKFKISVVTPIFRIPIQEIDIE